ncbi:MAG: SagB/ThcOx family dehydrogenase [Desulfomonilaceae bacterium]|nr:SagB/ThcOx family dehydrogenase [Desulfomonilaceae bacterium]
MIDSARAYHDGTAYDRHEMTGHFLDWGNQPEAFKSYAGFETVQLPNVSPRHECSVWDLADTNRHMDENTQIDAERLAGILLLSHAVTATTRHGTTDFHFRSVASAGALYPFELYVAVFDVPGVEDGLYHHDVAGRGLTLIRRGNALADLRPAIGLEEEPAPVLMFLLTAIYFRSSWKYRDRAYRYALLDTGHLAENLALALTSERIRFRICVDFEDDRVNGVLGLDTAREVCLAVVPAWGQPSSKRPGAGLSGPRTDLSRFSRVAAREVEYPVIHEAHAATSVGKALVERDLEMADRLGLHLEHELPLRRPHTLPSKMSYPEAVLKRRSMRNFVREQIFADRFSALLGMLCAEPLNRVAAEPTADASICVGFLAGNVEGLDPGLYVLNRQRETISRAARGFMMDKMTHVCLDQEWLANCAVHFLFLSNLDFLEASCGPRGYRHAMMTAGRLGQRIYVSATAMRLGCCGIGAYYDDEAASLLGLNDAGRLLYLVAAGPVRKYYR